MKKIKLLDVRSIVLAEGDKVPEADKDYFLTLRVARDSVEELDSHGEPGEPDKIYKLKVIYPESLVEAGTKTSLKIQKGTTQSQVLRCVLEDIARQKGLEPDDFYKKEMSKIIDHYKQKYCGE